MVDIARLIVDLDQVTSKEFYDLGVQGSLREQLEGGSVVIA